jgi:polyisoprenoid-binding protein YceI
MLGPLIPLLAMLLLVSSAAAAAETYVIDPQHTLPTFEIVHMGLSMQRGFFTNTAGKITLDRQAKKGTIDVEIGTGSLITASRVLTDVLKRDDYFNADQFPVMKYTARELVFEGDVPVAAKGELTLLGVTRPVTLAISSFRCGRQFITRRPVCGAEVTGAIKRSEFGMTTGIPAVAGDEVGLVIPVEAVLE